MMKINKGYIISFALGAIIFGTTGVIAATLIASSVSYDNTNSGISSNNVQGAIDELYSKANQSIPDTYKDLSTPVTAISSDILDGKTAYKQDGTIMTGSIGTYSGTTTYNPTNETVTIPTTGKYLTNDITINSIPSSYKNLLQNTTATAGDIMNGKTAYDSNGNIITGINNSITSFSVKLNTDSFSNTDTYIGKGLIDILPFYKNNFMHFTVNGFTTSGSVSSCQRKLYNQGVQTDIVANEQYLTNDYQQILQLAKSSSDKTYGRCTMNITFYN